MLANYTFKGGIPKKLGYPGVPTIPCSIKRNYVKTDLCDLGAGVSVMHLSLLGNVVISKNFLRTRKIMVMHSNEGRV